MKESKNKSIKPINKQETKKRQKYTAQFKEQALELAKRDGVPKAAKDLGVPSAMLYSWKAKQKMTGQPFEYQRLKEAELAKLKRDVARLQEENDFLKKAAAYFAKESKQGTQS